MLFSELSSLGAIEFLRASRDEIVKRGFSNTMVYEPYGGGVNIVGALAIACGATDKLMTQWDGQLEFAPTKDIHYGIFMELITFIEALVDRDIDEWCEECTSEQCLALISHAIDRLLISVI